MISAHGQPSFQYKSHAAEAWLRKPKHFARRV